MSYKGMATGQEVHAPAGIHMNALLAQGPILLLELNDQPEGLKRGTMAEAWLWKDGNISSR